MAERPNKPSLFCREGRWICLSLWATGIGSTMADAFSEWTSANELHRRNIIGLSHG